MIYVEDFILVRFSFRFIALDFFGKTVLIDKNSENILKIFIVPSKNYILT